MRAKTTPQAKNPITDPNGDKLLDGAEMITQLVAEEQNDDERTAEEAVHGVLEIAEARALATKWNETVIQLDPHDEASQLRLRQAFAQALATNIEGKAVNLLEEIKKDPQFIANWKKQIDQLDGSEEDKQITKADFDHFLAFAQHYKMDFPKGIHIDQRDILGILGHFGGVLIPDTTPNQPTKPATEIST